MNVYTALVIFYIGAAIGSFLSVIIHRTRHKLGGILWGRSQCPHCQHYLGAVDLIPIAGYLIAQGRCRYCSKQIAPHYILIELFTGIVFALLYLKFNFLAFTNAAPFIAFDIATFLVFLKYIVISAILSLIFFYDLLYQEIPKEFSYTIILSALVFNLIIGTPVAYDYIIGAGLGGAFFYLQFIASKGKWIGWGDIELGIAMGMILGWQQTLVALFMSYAVGSLISLWLILNKKAGLKTKVPFAPFLVTGTLIAVFFGNNLIEWYFNTMQF